MSALAEKLKLVGLGVLATVAVHLMLVRVAPAPQHPAPVPCTDAAHTGPQPVAGAPPLITRLDVLDRLQRVEASGVRDLFRFAERRGAVRRPAREQHTLTDEDLGSTVTTGTTDVAGNPLVFYGYILSRGDPPLAFVLLDDEIHLVTEGEWIRARYRLTGFRANALTIEDALTGRVVNLPLLGTL
jgi:hypothetical protein